MEFSGNRQSLKTLFPGVKMTVKNRFAYKLSGLLERLSVLANFRQKRANDIRFIVIIPYRNARNYLPECLNSLLHQTHTNWLAICADDASEAGSSEVIPEDPRFIKRRNAKRLGALENIYRAIVESGLEYRDDDVICFLDGDDYLLTPTALETVAQIYQQKPHCLLTYGQYVTSNGELGTAKAYTWQEFTLLRQKSFRLRHFRTFRYKLYREFLRQDPNVEAYKDKDGRFFASAYDVAIMLPLAEIAGYPNICLNEKPIYFYRLHPSNDHVVDRNLQQRCDEEARAKRPFKPTFLPLSWRLFLRFYPVVRKVKRQLIAMLRPGKTHFQEDKTSS